MGYNRPEAKRLAKQAMRTTNPHPMLVTLVYVLLTIVLTYLVSSRVVNPFTTFYWYVADGAYRVEDLIRALLLPSTVALFLVVQVVIVLFSWVMSFGYTSYALRMARNEQPGYQNLMDGFRTAGRAILVYLLINIFTTLWGLLAMVPAMVMIVVSAVTENGGLILLAVLLLIAGSILSVVISYRYRLAAYFLLDNPDMGVLASITESKRAMRGWKAELFVQDLSFFGWYLVMACAGILVGSLGLLLGPGAMSLLITLTGAVFNLWLTPYVWGTEANFYDWVVHGRYSGQPPMGPDDGYQSPYGNI